MNIQIKNRFNLEIIFECNADSLKVAVEIAVKQKVSLSSADLRSADLSFADLRSAYLRSAKNFGRDVIIETGKTWGEYLDKVVPELLKAGGSTVSRQAWECHNWDNCPMAEAFGVHDVKDIPILFRPRAEQFIRFFDANLIPLPEFLKENKEAE